VTLYFDFLKYIIELYFDFLKYIIELLVKIMQYFFMQYMRKSGKLDHV